MSTITQREYSEEIIRIVGDARVEAAEYGDDIEDLLCQAVDGHQWIIYYCYNDAVLQLASNPGAWEDCYSNEDIGSLVVEKGMSGARTVQAYCAMMEDINSYRYETMRDEV